MKNLKRFFARIPTTFLSVFVKADEIDTTIAQYDSSTDAQETSVLTELETESSVTEEQVATELSMPEEDYIGSTLKNLKEEILSLRFKIIFLFILLILKIYFASNIKENIAIYRIYYIFLYYIILRLIAEFVEIFILRIYNKKHGYELNHYDNFVLAVHRISLFLSHLIFFFILLDLFGLEFSKIIT